HEHSSTKKRSSEFCHSYYFFFQAEDGIRDGHVTGVQTCALPILDTSAFGADYDEKFFATGGVEALSKWLTSNTNSAPKVSAEVRSEERRVGKECRSRWGRYP